MLCSSFKIAVAPYHSLIGTDNPKRDGDKLVSLLAQAVASQALDGERSLKIGNGWLGSNNLFKSQISATRI